MKLSRSSTDGHEVANGNDQLIHAIVQEQIDGWCRGDAEGYAANAAEDLSFTNIRGQHWTGRAAFVKVHDSLFRGVYAGSLLRGEVERVRFPGAGVAVAEVLLHLSRTSGFPKGIASDADGVVRTRLLEMFELRDGSWTLIGCHNTMVIA